MWARGQWVTIGIVEFDGFDGFVDDDDDGDDDADYH